VIDRASSNDLMELATDVGPVPTQIAGVLVLRPGPDFDVSAAAHLVAARLSRVPRLRQRLRRAQVGCGRPYWLDDPRFDAQRHVRVVECAPPGDETALLHVAVAAGTQQLPPSRPLWAATLVTGLADGRVALVMVLHHVVADGIGGLAVLEQLVDGVEGTDDGTASAPRAARPPTTGELAADAWSRRWHALASSRSSVARLRSGVAQIRRAPPPSAARTTLNQPTGPRRRATVCRVDLAAVLATAHACHATVNDVVLTATTRALTRVLAVRGERPARLAVSVPVSERGDDARRLGNRVGVMPMSLPVAAAGEDPLEHLRSIARVTRARKAASRGSPSAVLVEPAFRGLAALGLLGWLMDHQRMINTVVSNVPGPVQPLALADAQIEEVIPISGVYGNVGVGFTALSYSGVLTLTVMADPDLVPELGVLTSLLQQELDGLAAAAP
jgi:diacylglycerol O-acyltransferase / wax synthase